MPNVTNDDRNARVERVLRHVTQNSNGIKSSEIADDLNLDRRTVDNYLQELQAEWRVDKDGPRWYPTNHRPMTLRKLELKPEQAMVIYLAVRLFVKQTDKRNVTAENVLGLLAEMLEADADVSGEIYDAAQELAQRPVDEGYEDIFKVVMQAYLYRKQLEIVYHPYKSDPFHTRFSPYLIEPSAIGFATYVIGHSSQPSALRTYKIARIVSATVIHDQDYVIPDDFAGLSLLKSAWSIYHGEETVSVTLRFAPAVARRVRETNWHPSQTIMNDGQHVLMNLHVDNTTDLLPWIRGWGASVEVVEPKKLRNKIIAETRKLMQIYNMQTGTASLDNTFNTFFGD